MRTTAKILSFLALVSALGNSAFASSPFDIILGRAPDITVTDMHQETDSVYMRVCNLGGSITDSSTSISLAMKRTGGGVMSTVEPIILGTNECHEFRMASVSDLGITTSGTYEITAGAILKDGRTESVKDNNKLTRRVDITYPSKYTGIQSGNYYSNTSNGSYCNSNNNYCGSNNYINNNTYYCSSNNSYSATSYCPGTSYSSSTTYYCIPGTSNCSTTPYSTYNNNSSYCNSSNNYCANNSYNGSTTYYRSNICPSYDYACNNSYYNSTNTQYRDGDNRYCTYLNNYCNNNGDYNNYRNDKATTGDCTYLNNYCNNNGNYNNNNYYYYNNPQYNLPDLVVQRVYQNSGDKNIIAQICNQGGDMRNSVSLRTNFTSPNMSSSITNSMQMSAGQCTSTIVYTTPGELDLVYSGNYSISVTADVGNNLSESNESNNTLTQYLYIESNRSQYYRYH